MEALHITPEQLNSLSWVELQALWVAVLDAICHLAEFDVENPKGNK